MDMRKRCCEKRRIVKAICRAELQLMLVTSLSCEGLRGKEKVKEWTMRHVKREVQASSSIQTCKEEILGVKYTLISRFRRSI